MIGPIEKDTALDDLQLGEIQGPAFAVVFALASVVIGRRADIADRRILLLGSISIWALGAFVVAVSTGFGSLLAGRMLIGAGTAAVMPLGASLIPDVFDGERRGVAFGVFLAGAVLGDALSVVVGGGALALLAAHPQWIVGGLAAWREVVLVAVLPLLVLLLLVHLIKEPKREQGLPQAPRRHGPGVPLSFLVVQWRLYLPYAFAMTAASIGGAASYWVPEVLRRDYGMTAAEIATRYGFTLTVSSLLGAGLGILAGRFARDAVRGFMVTAFAYLVIACALLAFMSGNALACLGAIAVYVMLDATTSVVLMTSIQTVTPPTLRGVTAALDRLFGVSLGYSIGQPLVGWLADHYQRGGLRLGTAMILVAVPAVVITAILLSMAGLAARRTVQVLQPRNGRRG